MDLLIDRLPGPALGAQQAEIVERKGLGHPDTLCDALAEELSLALSRFYLDRFGLILHHNVDKVLLWGGASQPAFGGGRVLAPIEIYLAGRAVREHAGIEVPVEELAVEGSQRWLARNLRSLDPDAHVLIHPLVRAGSAELVELFLRQRESGRWLANDTSCGVGYAPLSALERLVLRVERELNAPARKDVHPEIGEDVKVMGVRRGRRVRLTVACACVDRHVRHADDYAAMKAHVARIAAECARAEAQLDVEVEVNTADDPAQGSLYLTVTGTSAEAGDDGEAGRGNRVNGLITPYRPMTMESVAGKNPVTHVGKLYNLAAGLMAASVVEEIADVAECECRLVSQIGRPIEEPQLAQLALHCEDPRAFTAASARAEAVVREQLAALPSLWKELLAGTLALDRWPLRGNPAAGEPPRDERLEERLAMLREIEAEVRDTAGLIGRSALDPRVIDAMAAVPRHAFVPAWEQAAAYDNRALPIGHGQTISQPYIVALMTDLACVGPDAVVLEVGTGCGYQSAVLARLARRVHTIEIVPQLAEEARARLARLGVANVELRCGDGHRGWPERAPFDAILVTAAAPEIPPPLVAQLRPGGRLVIPVGASGFSQELLVLEKDREGRIERRTILPVAFVPLVRQV